MNKKTKHTFSSSWGLTAILTLILFGIIIILVSFMALIGYIGVRNGQITATYLLEKPIVVILAICIISLIISIVIMLIIQRLLIRPINQVTKAMQQLATGNFEERIYLKDSLRPREIKTFAESFNKTAEALSSVEILRTDFINNFSHEFKTPIHSLVGIAEFLKSGDCPPEEINEYLDAIIDQSKRLATLSTNVLYLTKLETETTSLEMKNLDLSELLRQRLLLFDYKCNEKKLNVKTYINPLTLYGNADLLSQMMGNILDNAIKFSPDGSSISVELLSKENYAVFKVKDHACGMDKETINRIFEKFYQGDASHATEGFGLGLPMVKKIVELHCGRLKVESQVGKGTAFTIELPVDKFER